MKVTDASAIVNEVAKQFLGSEIQTVDASNIVDIGHQLSGIKDATDVVYKTMVDRVGRFYIANKKFKSKYDFMWRDGWTFGNILEIVRFGDVEAESDPRFNLVNGQKYDSFLTYNGMELTAKFYKDYDNFQLTYWRPNPAEVLWSAFANMEEMTRFLSGIELTISNSMRIRIDSLARTCLLNMIGYTLYNAHPDGNYGSGSTLRAVNLLHDYNTKYGTALTAEKCMQDKDFQLYVATQLYLKSTYLSDPSKLFNIDGVLEYTSTDELRTVVLSEVATAINNTLLASTFHSDRIKMPNFDEVSFWQGSNGTYDSGAVGEINVTVKTDTSTHNVNATGILAIMFDEQAVGVNCERDKVTSFYNPDIDQTKFYDKYFAQYINRFDKNFVVFYVDDPK